MRRRNTAKRCVFVDTCAVTTICCFKSIDQCFAIFLAIKHKSRTGHLRRCNPCHNSTRDVALRATTLLATACAHVHVPMFTHDTRDTTRPARAAGVGPRCRLLWGYYSLIAHSDCKVPSPRALRLPCPPHPPAPRPDRCKTDRLAQMEINLGSSGQSESHLRPRHRVS